LSINLSKAPYHVRLALARAGIEAALKVYHKDMMQFIRHEVEGRGGQCWFTHQSGHVRGDKGVPDMKCKVNGLCFEVECKGIDTGDKVRPEQWDYIMEWSPCLAVLVGGVDVVADYLDLMEGGP